MDDAGRRRWGESQLGAFLIAHRIGGSAVGSSPDADQLRARARSCAVGVAQSGRSALFGVALRGAANAPLLPLLALIAGAGGQRLCWHAAIDAVKYGITSELFAAGIEWRNLSCGGAGPGWDAHRGPHPPALHFARDRLCRVARRDRQTPAGGQLELLWTPHKGSTCWWRLSFTHEKRAWEPSHGSEPDSSRKGLEGSTTATSGRASRSGCAMA